MSRFRAFVVLVFFVAPALAAAADPPEEPAPPAPARAPAVIHSIPRIHSDIAIDGRLDEPEWQEAAVIPLTHETRPGENIAPPVETECLVMHDSGNLYVAFRARDPRPQAIRAHLTDRDSAWDDDFVGVVLDTFNDERRAFEFFVNPLGVQMDLFMDDVGGNESSSWDAIWSSSGRITESGYEVEIAIPFHQLRFPRANGVQTWGFDAIRFYPRSDRHRIASQPMDRDVSCYLCQVSKVSGFEGISPGRNLEIAPTLTGSRTDERTEFPSGGFTEGDVDPEAGLTVRWGVTPNLALNAAINPDFSQVEADVAQLDVNTQFALFFPEKRPFFLEGADFFRTPLDAVFTRNVAEPDWGVKLTGKEGANAIGVFLAEDNRTNLLFPGSQGSDSGSFDFASTDGVLRYRRDFGKNSAVGLLATGREGRGYSNQVGGADGLYRIDDKNTVSFQYLSSETEYPLEVALEFEQPTGRFSDDAVRLNYVHSSRNWTGYARYVDIGEDFRADLGFMPQVGYTFYLGGFERKWWGEEDDWYNRFEIGADWDLTRDQQGNVLERELEAWTEISGPKQSYLWFDLGTRDRFFNGRTFDGQDFVQIWMEIQPNGDLWLGLFAFSGDAIDFANTRPGEVVQLEPNIRYNFGLHLRATLTHTYQRLDVDEGRLFEANLSQLRLVYQFNVRTFVRAILQYRRVERDPALFERQVDELTERLFTQLLFSYKLNPQTVLFFGYADNRLADPTVSLTQTDRTLFLKLGYAWNL